MAIVADFDPTTPSIARVYDYLLDGKDNFLVHLPALTCGSSGSFQLRISNFIGRATCGGAVFPPSGCPAPHEAHELPGGKARTIL